MTASFATHSDIPDPLGISPEPWIKDARCAEIGGDSWFPEGRGSYNHDAIRICEGCPVQAMCLDYAVRTKADDGIWGGKSITQIRRLIRERAA